MQQSINIVAVGVYRHVAAHLETLFRPPYQLAAILDIHSSPQPFTYSPHNLGTVLHALLPRPQVIITGLAIPDGMTEECIEVWDSYVKSMNVEKALVINLRGEPPKDGNWQGEILRRLEEKYKLPVAKEL